MPLKTIPANLFLNRYTKLFVKSQFTILMLMVILISGNSVYASDNPNKFNRLFVPPKDRTEPLNKDGIHDPAVSSLGTLQEPKSAFKPLDQSAGGNYVDWVKAIRKSKIKPRDHHLDDSQSALPMNLDIVMQVKGSMPDVSFPHKAHTEWLECNNCHTDIFIPKKGANRMSMLEIMLGQKCGVCHGSVAFPVTECRRCHSVTKTEKTKGNKKNSKSKKASTKK